MPTGSACIALSNPTTCSYCSQHMKRALSSLHAYCIHGAGRVAPNGSNMANTVNGMRPSP